MNYKYHIIGKDYILSPEEHKKVSELYKSGTKIIYLRNDTLMINMVFVGAVNETEDMTDDQVEKRDEYLKLPPEKRSQQTFSKTEFKPIIEKTNWQKIGNDKDWKNCAECGVLHLIPEDKEICLGCLGKKILAKK